MYVDEVSHLRCTGCTALYCTVPVHGRMDVTTVPTWDGGRAPARGSRTTNFHNKGGEKRDPVKQIPSQYSTRWPMPACAHPSRPSSSVQRCPPLQDLRCELLVEGRGHACWWLPPCQWLSGDSHWPQQSNVGVGGAGGQSIELITSIPSMGYGNLHSQRYYLRPSCSSFTVSFLFLLASHLRSSFFVSAPQLDLFSF
jgi:hypothetical protein